MMKEKIFNALTDGAIALGAYRASVIQASDIITDRAFRDMCEKNSCGVYGRCYMCPPDVGDIDELMGKPTL